MSITKWYILIISCILLQFIPCTGQEQYKKIHRKAIKLISEDKLNQSIKLAKSYLEDDPTDQESYFILAISYAQKDDIETALEHVNESLKFGLPFTRYLAGPRELLDPLIKSDPFQKKISNNGPFLLHGPMLSNVESSKAEFWLRTYKEQPVSVVAQEVGQEDTIKSSTFQTKSSNDYTATIDVTNLEPNTKYKYYILLNGEKFDKRWNFVTYPKKESPTKIKIGFGGGAGYTPYYKDMWNTLSSRNLSAFLFLGDNVYIDHPKYPFVQDYCYYRRQSSQRYQNFISGTSIYAIWDDHDFATNDSWGTPNINKPKWKLPIWQKFKNNWNNPYYGGGSNKPGVWTEFSMGDIDFFLLDGRYYRDSPTKKKPSMLGQEQLDWLFEQLKNSEATFKVIASPVPWKFGVKEGKQKVYGPLGTVKTNKEQRGEIVPRVNDTWQGYSEERNKIFSFITKNKIEGVILISADRHRSDAWKIKRENGYDLYEFESSKLTNIHTHKVFSESIFGYNQKCSFGLLKFNTVKTNPEVTYQIINIDNKVINKITIKHSQLQF